MTELTHREVLRLHDEAFLSSQDNRRRAADDLLFARVTQWDDPFLSTQLEYRGQFDQIRKARRHILGEMRANPVQATYIAGRDANEDTADLLERKYRFDMSTPSAKQALMIAQQDQLDCGVGAWRLVTDWENSVTNEQYIKREPIHEANNRVFRDPNCQMPDGSDARYLGVVWTVTDLGWPAFAEQIGLDPDVLPTFSPPENGWTFPWTSNVKVHNLLEFYYREKVTKQCYLFQNELGEQRVIKDDDIDDVFDELLDTGYLLEEERTYETYQVRKYWVSGGGFLNNEDGEVIPGTRIPIVMLWGEVAQVDSQWIWEGIVRLAKDPSRLRNFIMSYLADIVAKGARQRPYFRMSQIQGLEWQFEEGGPDDNRPYRVLNDYDDDGNPLEGGPVAYEQAPDLPQAAVGLLEASSAAIEDVTNPGIPQDIASSELSGKAVTALQNRVDMQSFTYLDNVAMALQCEAEIYAEMVPIVYDTPRSIGLLAEDGTEETADINGWVFDMDSGKIIKAYDFTKGEYRVRTRITPAHSSRRDQQRSNKIELYAASQGNPEAQAVILFEIMMLDDSDAGVSKKFARQRLLDMGLLEPESDDDKAYVEAQKNAEPAPDPAMKLAEAEDKKGEAELIGAKTDMHKAETDRMNAETKRLEAITKAKEIGVDLQVLGLTTKLDMEKGELDKQGKALENMAMMKELRTRELTLDLATGMIE